jgi:hypothetical protein
MPSGPSGAVQFNNAGSLGGDSSLMWSGLSVGLYDTPLLTLGVPASVLAPDLVTNGYTAGSGLLLGNVGAGPALTVVDNGTYGQAILASAYGAASPIGIQGSTLVVGGGTTAASQAFYGSIAVDGSGTTLTNASTFYALPAFLSNGGGITNLYQYWSADIAGTAVNPYYAWFDSRGVFRVKEDNTFNSVGQAIATLYNPQFTKYTPGAVNFERGVLSRWNNNVLEIGAEAGGTGVVRRTRLIGSAVQVPSGSSNPGCATTTDIGTFWFDTTTSTTAVRVCKSVSGSIGWSTLTTTP